MDTITRNCETYEVEYEYDPETRSWVFAVPALHIVGGGATRADAEQRAAAAIDYTLEEADSRESSEELERSH